MNTKTNFDPKGKKILAITAHADDADFACGGTMLKWLSQGAIGAIVIVTNGDKGTHDSKLTREQLATKRSEEQIKASQFIGLDHTWFLDYPDAHLEVTQELKDKLVKIIRGYKPDVVFTWDPTMVYSLKRNMVNHSDHRAVGEAVLDAVFPMARDFLTFPDHAKEGLSPHCVCDLFLFNFDNPNYYEDISDQIDNKLELLKRHESQIDPGKMRKILKEWNSEIGKNIDVDYAEPFVHISFSKD